MEIPTFSFEKKHLKISCENFRSFCLGVEVITSVWFYSSMFMDLSHLRGINLVAESKSALWATTRSATAEIQFIFIAS